MVGGIGIDLEVLAESADGREGVTLAEAARHHGFSGSVNDLLVELTAGLKLDVEGNHACTITCRTAKSRSRSKEVVRRSARQGDGTSAAGRVIRKRKPAAKLSGTWIVSPCLVTMRVAMARPVSSTDFRIF